MDDTWARELVERATAFEPPMGPIARNALRAGLRLRRRRRAQGAAVTAVAVLAVGAVPALALHASPPARPTAAGGQPRFTVSIPGWTGIGTLQVRDAVTGKITHVIKLPIPALLWDSLSAQSTGSFVATTETGPARLYRIRPSADGTSARVTRVATIRNAVIEGSAMSRSGTWFGYLDYYTPRRAPSAVYVRLQNLHTGKIYSWTVPENYTVGSLSIDAAGNALAVSAYSYLGTVRDRTALIQHTYLLRPASAGSLLTSVVPLVNQAGQVALAPDGRTLYETLQATGLTATSFRSQQKQTFEVAAISTATGRITAVLHTWHSSYKDFVPLLALDPTGRHLLIYDNKVMATLTLSTGHYTALRGKLKPELIDASHPYGPSGPVDPLAW
jgi:hypothetical protein